MLGRMYSLPTLRADLYVRNICFVRLLVGGWMSGFAACGPMDGPVTYLLHKLYLLPELHGRGLGRWLLGRCEADATELGARQPKLRVNKQNLQAITFYQRHGYRSLESVCTAIGGGFVMDGFVMLKTLGAVGWLPSSRRCVHGVLSTWNLGGAEFWRVYLSLCRRDGMVRLHKFYGQLCFKESAACLAMAGTSPRTGSLVLRQGRRLP